MLQEIVDEAEKLRQEECSKAELKACLWAYLVLTLQTPECEWARTTEVPACAKQDANRAKRAIKKKKASWEPDALWKHIAMMNPQFTEIEIECEKKIEELFVPWFQEHGVGNLVDFKRANKDWNDDLTDCQRCIV